MTGADIQIYNRYGHEVIGDFVPSTLDDLRSVVESCHIQTDAIYFQQPKSGALIAMRNHGYYALAHDIRTPENTVLLYTHDKENFNPLQADPAMQKIFPGYYVNAEKTPHIFIVEARDNRKDQESWVSTAHATHDESTTLNHKNFGYLWRIEEGHYSSGCVVYNVKENDKSEIKPHKWFIKPKTREELKLDTFDTLQVLTTSNKTDPFFDFNSNFLGKRLGKIMSFGGIRKQVPHSDIKASIMNDFLCRSHAVMRGIDPNDIVFHKDKDSFRSLLDCAVDTETKPRRINSFFCKLLMRATENSVAFFKTDKAGLAAVKHVGIALTQLAFFWATRGVFVAMIKLGAFFGSNLFKGLSKIFKKPQIKTPFDSDKDIAKEYGKPGYLEIEGASYYWQLDNEHANFLRYLYPSETKARPADGTELNTEMRDDLAALKLLDPLGAPEGSMFEKRHVNGMDVLRVIQPDGIEIYILPGKSVAYARYRDDLVVPNARPLAEDLDRLLKQTKQCLRVYFDPAGNNGAGSYAVDDISTEEFYHKLADETRRAIVATYEFAEYADPKLYKLQKDAKYKEGLVIKTVRLAGEFNESMANKMARRSLKKPKGKWSLTLMFNAHFAKEFKHISRRYSGEAMKKHKTAMRAKKRLAYLVDHFGGDVPHNNKTNDELLQVSEQHFFSDTELSQGKTKQKDGLKVHSVNPTMTASHIKPN